MAFDIPQTMILPIMTMITCWSTSKLFKSTRHQPFWNWELLLCFWWMQRVTGLIHPSEIMLKWPFMMLCSDTDPVSDFSKWRIKVGNRWKSIGNILFPCWWPLFNPVLIFEPICTKPWLSYIIGYSSTHKFHLSAQFRWVQLDMANTLHNRNKKEVKRAGSL